MWPFKSKTKEAPKEELVFNAAAQDEMDSSTHRKRKAAPVPAAPVPVDCRSLRVGGLPRNRARCGLAGRPSRMIIPPTWLAAGALALALAGFAGGWQVRAWRCDSQIAKIERAAEKARVRQQAQVEKAATDYETERHDANQATSIREREIRTKYVPVPGTCDPGDSVGRVLDDALADAARSASGEPRPTVSPAAR